MHNDALVFWVSPDKIEERHFVTILTPKPLNQLMPKMATLLLS
jgi:hypothetical protein